MKGQFRVINEILLFGIGAVIAFSVAATLSFSVNSIQKQVQRDQYYFVTNLISLAMSKTYLCGEIADCELAVDIPKKLGDDRYTISLSDNNISISNLKTGEEFKIKTINFGKDLKGSATSSARYFVLSSENNTITLSR